MKKRIIKIIGITLAILVGFVFLFAKMKGVSPLSWGNNEIHKQWFSNKAINGYDAVAFFKVNRAVLGDEIHSYNWKNADWNFSSSENKELFIQNPEKYAPQFGGNCTYAVGNGFTANIDPNYFEVINEKLYLFSKEKVKATWKENQRDNILKCEANW